MVMTDEGRVNRFKRRFAGLESISSVAVSGSAWERRSACMPAGCCYAGGSLMLRVPGNCTGGGPEGSLRQ